MKPVKMVAMETIWNTFFKVKAATKQLYEWLSPSVCLWHLFHYVPIIVSSWNIL